MLVAFSSPVKFSKSVFSGVKFRAKFEVVLQKTISVSRCEPLEIRLSYRKLSSRWPGNSTEIPSNTATIKEVNSTAIDSFFT